MRQRFIDIEAEARERSRRGMRAQFALSILFLLMLVIYFTGCSQAEAGVRSCSKRIIEIIKDPKSGIALKSADPIMVYKVASSKLSPKQQDLFEEIQDCAKASGSTLFDIEHPKGLITCRLFLYPKTMHKAWRCLQSEKGGA